ncbi:unnamed protein product [Caenorhabditis bovis]|uniref:polynucleotide adenylyltransferase n=1 Tax=Caenorhabditis bovis TaxID=2654633 RepID=A0A8S1EZI0_9PELO|nr:unnamed protein product [Caenorhabditis bovis]
MEQTTSPPSSSSSCCYSLDNGKSSSVAIASIEELVVRVYIYFKSMLIAVNRHKSVCEHIGNIMRDLDARWGYPTDRRSYRSKDPNGCLAPIYPNGVVCYCVGECTCAKQRLLTTARFPACWAVPQPAVFYSLLSNDIREYLRFLERIKPESVSQLRNRTDEPVSTDEALACIQRLQGMAPALNPIKFSCSTQSSSSTSLERTSTSSCCKSVIMEHADFDVDYEAHMSSDEDLRADYCFGHCCKAIPEAESSSISRTNSETSLTTSAFQSNIEPLSEADLCYIEQAHRDSKLIELYANLDWRFYILPKTSFCLPIVELANGFESLNPWRVSRKKVHKSAGDSECSDSAAISSDDANGAGKTPTQTTWRNGIKPPPPPTTILSPSGQYQVSHMDVLSEKIWHYHNSVSQKEEMLSRKLNLRDMLYSAISPVFPMCGLYVVGSSLNGFGNNSSDMDLCLMITNRELDQRTDAVVVLNLILTTLQYEKFVRTQKLILAKVPILRIQFAEPFSDITVDLNANNSVAIKNTHLLCYYSSYDWRVRPLVSVVKEWAKRKGINDANKSSFTSYSLVLMVIHYLQCGTTPAVLPNLQKLYPHRFSNKLDVRSLNITTSLENPTSEFQPEGEDTATLGQLLIGFLNYYANKFDYDRDAISIRQGQKIERASVARPKNLHGSDSPPPSSSASSVSVHGSQHSAPYPTAWRSQWRCVCIEEPFTNSNTAHSIYDEMVFGAIKEAFREAHTELSLNHDLDRLLECSPINVSIPCTGAVVYDASYEGDRPPVHPAPQPHRFFNNCIPPHMNMPPQPPQMMKNMRVMAPLHPHRHQNNHRRYNNHHANGGRSSRSNENQMQRSFSSKENSVGAPSPQPSIAPSASVQSHPLTETKKGRKNCENKTSDKSRSSPEPKKTVFDAVKPTSSETEVATPAATPSP